MFDEKIEKIIGKGAQPSKVNELVKRKVSIDKTDKVKHKDVVDNAIDNLI